jgi:hypothetical protein
MGAIDPAARAALPDLDLADRAHRAAFERAMAEHGGVHAAHGAGDLFPTFTADEASRVAKEGKIPVHASWRDRVKAGTASWDGILTAAALASFTIDQQALDDRIRRFV